MSRRRNTSFKQIGSIVAGVIVALLAFDSYFTVKETQRAVLTQFGRFVEVRGPGLNWRIPIIQGAAKYPIDIQAFHLDKINTYTVDNQELDALFTVNYRNPASNVENVFKNIPDYEERLKTLTVDRFKAEVGRVNVTEIAQKRGETRDRILKVLKNNAHDLFGLEVTDFQITNIDYNKTFREANNAASVAKAKVEQAEQEKRQALIDADREKIKAAGEANAIEEKARGDANGLLLNAEAEAKAIKLKGEAEAYAIRAQAAALAQNRMLVELRKAERWDGALPTSMFSNVMPFMNVDQRQNPLK